MTIAQSLEKLPSEIAFEAAFSEAFDRADAEGSWTWRPTAHEAFMEGWNRREAIAASEPADVVAIVGDRGSVSWRSDRILPVGTKLYTGQQTCACGVKP